MNKFLSISILFLILFSGCTSFNQAMNNSVENVTQGIINEMNETLSNISNQINDGLNQGLNDSINQFISGLTNQTTNAFLKSPISTFTLEDINYLGINCSGSEQEIAECIKDWQINNMDYDATQPDSSYSIRWNYAFPGLYPSNEIIKEKVNNGRIYGICVDYALIFCSIAQYYGLDCRIMNSLTKPSDRDSSLLEFATGLGMEEYNDLIIKLKSKGMDYPYELIRQVMKETPEHYWAEVKINNEWLTFDASNTPTGGNVDEEYKNKNDYEITLWENNNTCEILKNYVAKVDDLGQSERSFTIDDYFGSKISGQAIPVAYYNSCTDVCGFFDGKNPTCTLECPFSLSFYSCYDSCSGKKFYKICDFVCNDEEPDYEQCYGECSGEELNIDCFESC